MHLVFLRNLIIVRNKNEIDHNNLRIALEHEAERDSIQNERVRKPMASLMKLVTNENSEQ